MRRVIAAWCGLVVLVFVTDTTVAASSRSSVQGFDDGTTVTGASAGAPRPRPLVVQAPGEIEISIRIVPTLHTKELRVYADSESYYRSTTIGLNGLESSPVHTFTWHGFPAGDYDVVGELIDDSGTSEVVVRGTVKVIGQ